MTPYALGQNITFIKDEGPKLDEFKVDVLMQNNKEKFSQKLGPVYKAIEITRKKLEKNKSLICFIGAPWTLLVYMFGLKKDNNNLDLDKYKKYKKQIKQIIIELNDYLCIHINSQINAGADVVQIFDSWAGLILPEDLPNYCYIPNLKIVDFCKERKIPVICFPKGINEGYKEFNNVVKPDGINLDYDIDPVWAKENLLNVVLQGGLSPKVLLLSDKKILQKTKKYLDVFRELPYVFNLGHGLIPETDPDKVKKLIEFYREY